MYEQKAKEESIGIGSRKECWETLDQERIQRWVDRIKVYIEEIIRLEGGNEYMEGSSGVSFRTRWKVGAPLVEQVLE